jgi:hypothetical protein
MSNASSRSGMRTGGWLAMRYLPLTVSPSFDSACMLSLVCAFSAARLACLAARLAIFACSRACFF